MNAAAVHRGSAADSAGATPYGASNDALFNRIALATWCPDARSAPARGVADGRGARGRPRRGEGVEIGADGVNGDFQPLRRLYIVLHNIDGQQLRSPEAQAILGELASMPRVHLIASVDHVNAPLLWSKREAARFNWVWQEATTFAPYALETSFLRSSSRARERRDTSEARWTCSIRCRPTRGTYSGYWRSISWRIRRRRGWASTRFTRSAARNFWRRRR